MGLGRRSTSGSRAGRRWDLGRIEESCAPRLRGLGSWTGTPRSTRASCGPTSTPRGPVKGARLDPGKPPASAGTVTGRADHQAPHHLRRPRPEPGHAAHPRAGRRHQQLVGLVDAVRVARPGGVAGPDATRSSDRGQGLQQPRQPGSAAGRHIGHTIPERDDQKANRARRGPRGGRPPAFDRVRYRNRNQVERLMNRRKQFRGGDPLRQARRPLPGHHHHRRHLHLAPRQTDRPRTPEKHALAPSAPRDAPVGRRPAPAAPPARRRPRRPWPA